ncbi:sensor histidine kinase [Acidimangrovimonas sediminis]|uniref:sensor histidine kinase n=1 Tax=Acidimangrovimonas sediminis TaxID=2056283 RepID=UPI000C804DD8|nr:sensor histidine kinase [Acidimangrovimonas sediminis]
MTLASRFDSQDSAAPKSSAKPGAKAAGSSGDVLLGEDWVASDADPEARARHKRSRLVSLNRSPLARKIITFNLMALILLVAGVLYLNPFRDSLVQQRENALVAQAGLIASMVENNLPAGGMAAPDAGPAVAATARLAAGSLAHGVELFLYDADGMQLSQAVGQAKAAPLTGVAGKGERNTVITSFLNWIWDGISGVLTPDRGTEPGYNAADQARALVAAAAKGTTQVNTGTNSKGATIFAVATPIVRAGKVVGVVAATSAAGEIDQLVRYEREQVLQMFVIAILVSVGLSLVLASTIANPLSDLAAAAELGRDRQARKMSPARVRIPDLAARPDEIGRLSIALRGMVAALYDRIEANEQFAADVAHEIKNPLASLRSAVASMRLAKRDDQREKLLGVIEHDVRRLDRLVSEISNASRLDSELVKEEEEQFNLLKMLGNLGDYLGKEAAQKGVDFITDLPSQPILVHGLEARLAQVFVNLITNAVSFCEDGDAVRVWARQRENRVLVVVEDTGPGIPDQALGKIFKRFYSERPPGQFGDHSGLGLSISKQIVEAHGGVIWAENIRPTDADATSEPLGARFVVGLPV